MAAAVVAAATINFMSVASQSGKSLHDQDLVMWATQTAELLRQGANLTQDERETIAEELYDIGLSDRRQLESRTDTLIMHLLKVKYQPEKRTRSWDLTIATQRRGLRRLLRDSPSLNRVLEQELQELYVNAREDAEIETGLDVFPKQNPFTLEQILNG